MRRDRARPDCRGEGGGPVVRLFASTSEDLHRARPHDVQFAACLAPSNYSISRKLQVWMKDWDTMSAHAPTNDYFRLFALLTSH